MFVGFDFVRMVQDVYLDGSGLNPNLFEVGTAINVCARFFTSEATQRKFLIRQENKGNMGQHISDFFSY